MATIGVVSSALSDQEHQVQLRRAVIASTIGTAIEWYDFFLYSVSVIECFETDGGVNYRSDRLI